VKPQRFDLGAGVRRQEREGEESEESTGHTLTSCSTGTE
jgi:hypothetical protein